MNALYLEWLQPEQMKTYADNVVDYVSEYTIDREAILLLFLYYVVLTLVVIVVRSDLVFSYSVFLNSDSQWPDTVVNSEHPPVQL